MVNVLIDCCEASSVFLAQKDDFTVDDTQHTVYWSSKKKI